MKDEIIANLIRVLITIPDGFVTVSVMHMYFSEKIRIKVFVMCSLALGISIYLMDILLTMYTNIFFWSASVVIYFLIYAFAKFSVKKKLSDMIIPALLLYILNFLYPLVLFLTLRAMDINVLDFRANPAIVLVNISFYVVEFVVLYLAKKLTVIVNFRYRLSKGRTALLVVYSVLLVLMLAINIYVICWYTGKGIDLAAAGILLIASILYIVLNLLFYFNLSKYENVNKKIIEHRRYYEKIKAYNRDLSVIKHGYDNTLASIYGFVEQEQWEPLAEYLEQVIESSRLEDGGSVESKGIIG